MPSCDDKYAQRQSQGEGGLIGVVRTMTCTLISSRAMPCIDAIPIPAATNEMGQFETSLRSVTKAYDGLDLFRMISYDAGATSDHNARVVRELGLHYIFALKGTQPTLLTEAQRLLAPLPWHHRATVHAIGRGPSTATSPAGKKCADQVCVDAPTT